MNEKLSQLKLDDFQLAMLSDACQYAIEYRKSESEYTDDSEIIDGNNAVIEQYEALISLLDNA